MSEISKPHMISLHGGHSGEFCDHARGTLRETIEAAIAAGFHTFGVSEHVPRVEDRFLYSEERDQGWTVATLEEKFEAYGAELRRLSDEYADRIMILRGFEAEVVPTESYRELMLAYRQCHDFEFMVGSVHYVREIQIDGRPENYWKAAEEHGGLEPFAIAYYETVTRMVEDLRPEVVGHIDLIRRHAPSQEDVATAPIRAAAAATLEVVRDHGAILDLNVAGIRKGLGGPYPAPWLVKLAHDLGIGFCFGTDSHGVDQIGPGMADSRQYLLENGVSTITGLTREDGEVVRRRFSLE